MKKLALVRALPEFAAELEESLRQQGYAELTAQIATLPIVDRCRCGDDFCSTFHTAPAPVGSYGPGHSTLEVDSRDGMIILDLVDDKTRCVEVLDRPDVQKALFQLLP